MGNKTQILAMCLLRADISLAKVVFVPYSRSVLNMKVPSCIHSFSLLVLMFFTFHSSFVLSIDSKDIANLQPRLDDGAVVLDARSSSSPTRRRKNCSFNPPASSVSLLTSTVLPLVTGSPPGGPNAGSSPADNASTLANQLSYARSYKTKCIKKTGTAYLASSDATPAPQGDADIRSSGTGSGVPVPSAFAESSAGKSDVPASDGNIGTGSLGDESNAPGSLIAAQSPMSASGTSESNQSGDSESPAVASGNSPIATSSANICGPQQTITVTSRTTITVTQIAGAAVSAGAYSGSSNANPVNGFRDTHGAASSGPNPNGAIGSKRTKCARGGFPSTALASGASASGSPGLGSTGLGSSESVSTGANLPDSSASGPSSLRPSESALTNAGSLRPQSAGPLSITSWSSGSGTYGSIASNIESSSGPCSNGTSGALSPTGSSSPAVPLPASNSTNATSSPNING